MLNAPVTPLAVRPPFSVDACRQERVTELVHDCKNRMLALYLEEAERVGVAPLKFIRAAYATRLGGDDMAVIEAYLRLDFDILAMLPKSHREKLAGIVEEARSRLTETLSEDERREFEVAGIRTLLAIKDYPVVAEFLGRVNGIALSGKNEGDYSGLFCEKPFLTAEIAQEGRTFLCCPLQLPTVVGDATDGDFLDVWNSEKAQAVRLSILDGSFSHCREKTCGLLQPRSLPRREEVTDPYLRHIIDFKLTRLPRGPTSITMNYDRSCNLACPTCRPEVIGLKGQAKTDALAIQEWATDPKHLKHGCYLHFTGSGDAFASSVFQSFLQQFDPTKRKYVRIGLGTNGLLFNEKSWARMCHEAVDVACISIDAATPATYAQNRGGDFDILLANLRFIGNLRASGQLKLITINFVVQANNYAEMPQFADLGHSIGVDMVFFQQLVNWGTFSRAEFLERAIHLPGHSQHGQFLKILQDPRLAHPIVNLHNLSTLARVDTTVDAPASSKIGVN